MHRLPGHLLGKRVSVLVVGAGGSGSAIVSGLPWLHQSMLAFGHPRGIDVTVIDPDTVSPANCVRQAFTETEVGLPKAHVLVNRVNLFFGFAWKAVHGRLGDVPSRISLGVHHDIVIGCVDTRAARDEIRKYCARAGASYWLDLGNGEATGQFLLGEPNVRDPYIRRARDPRSTRALLPTVAEHSPELVDASLDDDALPSCSALEALTRQAPFINHVLAYHALFMLAELFRFGRLAHHGAFVNPRTGRANPIPVPPPKLRRGDGRLIRELRNNDWPREMAEYALELDPDELDVITDNAPWAH